ncbi:MAG TPA: SigE family RNA polymerase sigma factor [Jatrophihabitans sp.]|nr:SigE family RNA polymerase sigma factor [Jatrophihabitans sp.]
MLREVGFAGFVREHTPALLRTAYLLTGNGPQAEELVQDTLVRLYPKWERVENADAPLAYVRRSLTNAYINQQRRAARREFAYEEVPERVDPYDHTTQLADRDQIWAGLSSLSQRQRAALVLRFFEDLSDEQTAAALGCRVGTVRSLISRGLATLRARMTEVPRHD